MKKRPTISLCLIAKNEAHNIKPLFDSIEGCFDEVILVDTGSTDDTVKLATELGAKVFHFEWVNDFAKARNFSFEQASCDYVCWMDLDDSLRNKEAFIKWRDHVMMVADFWLANYHYAFNFESNQPLCTFPRERVVKRSKGFSWRYFVHEGIMPPEGAAIATQMVGTWDIVHRRSPKDFEADKSRNISLFELHNSTDTRMLFYHGKELFENRKAKESIPKLSEAFSRPELAPHDRILCMQYLVYAHLEIGENQKAFELAQVGINLDANRAEFHVAMGDSKVKLGDLVSALPFYYAAKHCRKNTSAAAQFVFANLDAYGAYPSNAIVKVYANMGLFDEAEKEALEAKERYNHPETEILLTEIKKLKATHSFDVGSARDCTDIIFSCFANAYEWDGVIYRRQGIGGSETAEIELAEWFARLNIDRKIIIFNSVTEERHINSVVYRPIERLNEYLKYYKPWIHIAWRHNNKICNATTIVHSHDLQTPGIEALDSFDKVAVLTPWHRDFMNATQGVPFEKMFLTGNGIIPERFTGIEVDKKDPYSFIFSSSPDRGLDRAIRVLDEVRKEYPAITLKVFYGIEHLPKYGLTELHDKLKKLMDERDWIFYHGKTEQKEMMKHFKTASYCVQPSNFLETFGISALEQVCSGIYPIFRLIGGIADTLQPFVDKGMASLIDSDCVSDEEYSLYIDEVKKALKEQRHKLVKVDAESLSWKNKAIEWMEEFKRLKGE